MRGLELELDGVSVRRMLTERTLAEAASATPPRSFWRARLARRAHPLGVHEYLIDEANVRGVWGAFRAATPERSRDDALDDEDLVVGLLAPQAPVDVRILKLVLRLLQSGKLDTHKLLLRARRERSIGPLFWLLERVPAEERTEPVERLTAALLAAGRPRGYRDLDLRYDATRLIRTPAHREDLWRLRPRSS